MRNFVAFLLFCVRSGQNSAYHADICEISPCLGGTGQELMTDSVCGVPQGAPNRWTRHTYYLSLILLCFVTQAHSWDRESQGLSLLTVDGHLARCSQVLGIAPRDVKDLGPGDLSRQYDCLIIIIFTIIRYYHLIIFSFSCFLHKPGILRVH